MQQDQKGLHSSNFHLGCVGGLHAAPALACREMLRRSTRYHNELSRSTELATPKRHGHGMRNERAKSVSKEDERWLFFAEAPLCLEGRYSVFGNTRDRVIEALIRPSESPGQLHRNYLVLHTTVVGVDENGVAREREGDRRRTIIASHARLAGSRPTSRTPAWTSPRRERTQAGTWRVDSACA